MPDQNSPIFSFDKFQSSNLQDECSFVFTQDLAMSIYRKLAGASINPGSPVYLSVQIEFCKWAKDRIETFNSIGNEALQGFLCEFNKRVEFLSKNVTTPNELRFYNAALEVRNICHAYIHTSYGITYSSLSIGVDNELSLVTEAQMQDSDNERLIAVPEPTKSNLIMASVAEAILTAVSEYTNTNIPTTSLLSAHTARCIYKILIDMSKVCGEHSQLYRHDDCVMIKNAIESATDNECDLNYVNLLITLFQIHGAAIQQGALQAFIESIEKITQVISQNVFFRHPTLKIKLQIQLEFLNTRYQEKCSQLLQDAAIISLHSLNALMQTVLCSLPWITLGWLTLWGGCCAQTKPYAQCKFFDREYCHDRICFPYETAVYNYITYNPYVKEDARSVYYFFAPATMALLRAEDFSTHLSELRLLEANRAQADRVAFPTKYLSMR